MKKGVFKMTADAKVGLLLGLFFIVIIAFLVNGLPNFIHEKDTSTTSVSIVTPAGQDMVLDNSTGASGAAHRLFAPRTSAKQRTVEPPQGTIVLDSTPEQTPQVENPDLVPQQQMREVVQNNPAVVQEVAAVPKRQTHVVKSGEILPVIAKHYYGSEEGNRRIVIQKLYEANTSVLKSPDHVRVGQKLKIPPLNELLRTDQVVSAPSATKGVLQKISEVFVPVEKEDIGSISEYTVRKGDNLWSIAEENLGDGNRYKEIAQLNKGRIRNANNVAVGTRLVIPPQ
ncbi:MAG: LysM peptidoglycan-binding domain-containing protein [Anaerohalosphaeraceae bacterium]